jgi:membrane-associated phospholipid phosphatase
MTTLGVDGAGAAAHRPTHCPGRVASALGLVVVAVLAWSFGVFDEPISQALRSPDAGWAVALEMYGQLPGVIVGIVGATILLRLAVPTRGVRGWVGAVLVVLMLMLSSLQVALELGAHAGGETDVRRAIVVAVPVAIAAVLVSRWLSAGWAASVRPAALIALTLPYLASVATVWAIKIPWGRWTPRDITAAGDPALFSPWYLPQGANGHYSFVSGHTSFAVAVIALVLVVAQTRRAFAVGVLVCLTWGVVCAVSRVVLGAHFPSDTLFAAVATLAWVLLLARAVGYRLPQRGGPPPQASWSARDQPDEGGRRREVVRQV